MGVISAARPELDTIHQSVVQTFPPLSEDGRRAGLVLLRLLMDGAPVRREHLASILDRPTREVVGILEQPAMCPHVLTDDTRSVTGFGGLTVEPTAHRFSAMGKTAFTWCAWDGFFLPELVASEAVLESTCPATGKAIRLTVGPGGVDAGEGAEPVLSFLMPSPKCGESAERCIAAFCSEVNLLATREDGSEWIRDRDGLFLVSLAEGFELARRYNASRFGDRLRQART